MSKKKASINFDDAYTELQAIHAKIQDDNISIEEISTLIRRSTQLIKFCKKRLRSIEGDIDQAFEEEVE
jgi:exodeoxyribonuclease VII small subunit